MMAGLQFCRWRRLLFVFAAMPILICPSITSCGKKSSGSSDKKPEAENQIKDAAVKSDTGGVVVANIDSASATRLRASADSGIAGTEILFPAGSLGIIVDVTVGEGPTFDVASAQTELGIDSSIAITPTTGTLILTSSQVLDPQKPITVTMPLKSGAGLLPAGTKYAVLSQVVRTSTAGSANNTVTMINANAGVTEAEGKVTFPINYFGAHSVVTVPESFSETKEAPSARSLPEPKKAGVDPVSPTPALAIDTVTPADNAALARPASVEVKFNQNVDLASAQSFVTIMMENQNIPASITVDGARVVVNPSQSLALGVRYRILIGAEVKSSAGKSLGTSSETSFTVNEGAWGGLETLSGLANNSMTSLTTTRLNQGRFGLSAIQGAEAILSLQFDGAAWGPPQAQGAPADIVGLATAGGIDGRHYVSYTYQSAQPLYAMRYFPALTAAVDVGASSRSELGTPYRLDSFVGPRTVSLGQGKALFLAKRQDQAFVSRLLDGDALGSLEVPVAAEANSAYEWNLAANEKGEAALIFYRQVSTDYRLNVFKRSSTGSWSNLTPTGSELSTAVWSSINVGIANDGKVSAFWCTASQCQASTHDGSSWGTIQNLGTVTSMPNQKFDFDPKSGTAMTSWRVVINSLRLSTYTLYSATFSGGQWSSVLTMDSNSPNAVDPAPVAFDAVGRVRAVWRKDGVVKSARFANGSWGPIQDVYSGVIAGQPVFNCDYSGECLFVWAESGGILKYIRYK